MNTNLMQINDGAVCPSLIFDDTKMRTYKVYHDGSHHVGTLCLRQERRKPKEIEPQTNSRQLTDEQKEKLFERIMCEKREKCVPVPLLLKQTKTRSEMEEFYDSVWQQAVKSGIRLKRRYKDKFFNFIKPLVQAEYPKYKDLDNWVTEMIESSLHNYYAREKRCKRKAYLNKWSYFVTFTYDENKTVRGGGKLTPELFRKKLRMCLSHLHCRRGWNYIGVFEHAPETGRLHFHAIIYVPRDEMVGKIEEKTEYSTAKHEMSTRHENTFFAKRFGVNDFDELSDLSVSRGRAVDYILKYMGKDNERIVYSRGVPSEVYMKLDKHDIATSYQDFVTKYVLFDDVVNWKMDVLGQRRIRYTEQMSISDIAPPLTA